MAKLGEVCKLNMGQSPDSSSYNDTGDGIPFFQGNADFGEVHPNIRVWCNAPTKIAHPGEILISVRAPIGAMNIADCECCIGRGLASISVDESICTTKYLWYDLFSKIEELNSKGTGSTFKAINKKTLEETEVQLRDMDEQRKISETLDKITQLVSLRKQQLAKLEELVKARFVEMFGDPIGNTKNLPVTKFVDVVKMQRGFDLPVQERKSDGMIPVYGSNGVLGYHDISKVKGGGVITGRSGTIGKVFYEKGEFWPLNTTLFSLNLHGNDVVYLKYLLELFDLSRFTEGTGVPTLNRNKFHDELIIDVPLDEQERFAAFVERVDQQKQTVQQSLEKLELVKKALMQEYFG